MPRGRPLPAALGFCYKQGDRVKHLWDPQLSEHEIFSIGLISVHWASLEHLIFLQTLQTYEAEGLLAHQLPKEMNNIQFTGVLELWRERVAQTPDAEKSSVLLEQYDLIVKLKPARDALAHGMWSWSSENLGTIATERVKKQEVITSHFSAKALQGLALELAEINYKLRFPRGLADRAEELMRTGGFISRRAMAAFTGAPTDKEGYPIGNPRMGEDF